MDKQVALKAALHGEVTDALAKFRHDLGFTAPELISMRIDELDQRLHGVVDHVIDNLGAQ